MDKSGLVSIIVPIYNQEKYLPSSLPSILGQSYSNIEVILVDDGSTDSSGKICDEYKLIDNVCVVHQKNGGLGKAVVKGIECAKGDYICFVDPDDDIGKHFIESFIEEMNDAYDLIAMGFYRNNKGILSPVYLDADINYCEDTINRLKNRFLYNYKELRVSNEIYIARWHKMYSASCAKAVCREYDKCGRLMLGEDSIFTYLALKYCKKVHVVRRANSYYYNVSNQNSMMHSFDVKLYLQRCTETFKAFGRILTADNQDLTQAYALYYFLVETLLRRMRNSYNYEQICVIYSDPLYNKSVNELRRVATKYSDCLKLRNKTKRTFHNYERAIKIRNVSKVVCSFAINNGKNSTLFIKRLWKDGVKIACKQYQFQYLRQQAFSDMNDKIHILENEITPLLEKFRGKTTDLDKCPIEKNVFVFWWDGFENAPSIVQECFASVERSFLDCNIMKITKDNYQNHTDIHADILKAYMAGEISIQTFSDILRFNLLKNNGGVWIDATIFFGNKFDVFSGLEKKSYDSVNYAATADFLKYKGENCSWSGFFVASRKNGLLVTVMDSIFEEYFLKYKKYPTYFFIDISYMVCKIKHIDDDVLKRVSSYEGNMYALFNLLDEEYNGDVAEAILRLPQKLSWRYISKDKSKNTFYNTVVRVS